MPIIRTLLYVFQRILFVCFHYFLGGPLVYSFGVDWGEGPVRDWIISGVTLLHHNKKDVALALISLALDFCFRALRDARASEREERIKENGRIRNRKNLV